MEKEFSLNTTKMGKRQVRDIRPKQNTYFLTSCSERSFSLSNISCTFVVGSSMPIYLSL